MDLCMEDVMMLLRGFVIGIAIAAPVGPVGVLCIRRTLAQGRWTGLVSGLGAATADALYGSIAGFGLVFLSGFLIQQQVWLRLIGGFFLLFLGVKTALARPTNQPARAQAKGLLGAYGSTFFLTLTNPMTILSFSAVFVGLGLANLAGDYLAASALVLGVFLGSASWWLILSGLVSLFRDRMRPSGLTWVNRLSGAMIFSFGVLAWLGVFQSVTGTPSLIVGNRLSFSEGAISQGYTWADGSRQLIFPGDYGAHPDYQTEWWYYTGNLIDPEGRRFGYQLTFFRRALVPPQERLTRASDWATDQVYLAHFAITDVQSNAHLAFERLSRGAAGLAGAKAEPFQVWLQDWKVEETSPATYHLHASQGIDQAKGNQTQGISLDLVLVDVTGPVLQGDQGYSQKGPDPGNASYYFSQPRLTTRGRLQTGDQAFEVEGISWMDHEFSTSALPPGEVGWDWFSIQLDEGSELMVYQFRRDDGSIDIFSSGTWIAPDGTTRHLERKDFEISVTNTWKSPHTGGVYPAGWVMRISELDLELVIKPVIPDQEMNLSYIYWEGAVEIEGKKAGISVSGMGYVELTGYAGSMAGEF